MALFAIMSLSFVSFFWSSSLLHYRALAVLLRNVSPENPPWIARLGAYAVEEKQIELHLDTGDLRAKLYRPRESENPPGLVLVHGIHQLGMNEPRSRSFARALASVGVLVLAPEIPELTDYRVELSTVNAISGCAAYLARVTGRTATGVAGISFAGGLALIAAADPKLQKSIGFVVAVGAHHDLTRLVHYYAGETVKGPDGQPYDTPPHPYGARVLIYSYLDELFTDRDRPIARETLRTYLHDEHKRAKSRADQLSEEGKKLMLRILDHDDEETVHRILMSLLEDHRDRLQSVSPRGKLANLKAQVLLIHGADDPVVPATETPWLAREIPSHLLRQSLVTPIMRHAEIEQKPAMGEYIKLVHFIADLLALTFKQPMAHETKSQ
jgi:pimeloyl-ACP methyl ester carboxylesterase